MTNDPNQSPTEAEMIELEFVRRTFAWAIERYGKAMTPKELADVLISSPPFEDLWAAAHKEQT